MAQSQDIGKVRLELILKALSAPGTKISCRAQQMQVAAGLRVELLARKSARIEVRKKPVTHMAFERSALPAVI